MKKFILFSMCSIHIFYCTSVSSHDYTQGPVFKNDVGYATNVSTMQEQESSGNIIKDITFGILVFFVSIVDIVTGGFIDLTQSLGLSEKKSYVSYIGNWTVGFPVSLGIIIFTKSKEEYEKAPPGFWNQREEEKNEDPSVLDGFTEEEIKEYREMEAQYQRDRKELHMISKNILDMSKDLESLENSLFNKQTEVDEKFKRLNTTLTDRNQKP